MNINIKINKNNSTKKRKRKVSDELIIEKYLELHSYRKVSALLRATEYNVRQAIEKAKPNNPAIQEIHNNIKSNLKTYNNIRNINKDCLLEGDGVIIEDAGQPDIISPPDIDNNKYNKNNNNNNIYNIPNNNNTNNNFNSNTDTNNTLESNTDTQNTIIPNKKIITDIDLILEDTLKKLKKAIKQQDLTAIDYNNIISKLVNAKISLNPAKKEEKKPNQTLNIFGSPEQAAQILHEMKKINKGLV